MFKLRFMWFHLAQANMLPIAICHGESMICIISSLGKRYVSFVCCEGMDTISGVKQGCHYHPLSLVSM